ncbi:MAG: SsrA-binding protein SmpB [Parcubacteria group bacterium]|jgi:SsrA-binding protein
MNILAKNKRATFDYELQDKYEAGLVLTGPEVKSIKTGHISLNGSFVTRKSQEFFLTNASIPPYKFSGEIKNYDPTRSRKVLLKKSEIKHLIGKMNVEGLTLVPLCVYTKRKLIKLEFAVGRGKKQFDKRDTIQKREAKRKMERTLKNQ